MLVAALSGAAPAHAGFLCSKCKTEVAQLLHKLTSPTMACTPICAAIAPEFAYLCPIICGALDSLCRHELDKPKNALDCGQYVCDAISVCETNPWYYETVWNFSLPTYSPALPKANTIVLTSYPPSDDVPEGQVKMGIRCPNDWWKAITMFSNQTYIKDVAHTQDQPGVINWGYVQHQELANHYFILSKAESFGIHYNVYHIVNAEEMKERGTYLFDWQVDTVVADNAALTQPALVV
jgi:hypothetical protein